MITLNIDVTMLGPIALILGLVVGSALCFLSFGIEDGRGMGLSLLGACVILIGVVLNDTLTPSNQERYSECIADNYTVFLNGEEVSYPDKLNVKGYKISFDDKNKEVRLSD
mgnify:CR=1 FL=1